MLTVLAECDLLCLLVPASPVVQKTRWPVLVNSQADLPTGRDQLSVLWLILCPPSSPCLVLSTSKPSMLSPAPSSPES